MEGHAKGAGIAYTAIATADTGYFFDRISYHDKLPSLFMVSRHCVINLIDKGQLFAVNETAGVKYFIPYLFMERTGGVGLCHKHAS